jgi:hypothetical protein
MLMVSLSLTMVALPFRAPTWCTVLMSALQVNHSTPDRDGMRLFKWKQPVPTPAYLSKYNTALDLTRF